MQSILTPPFLEEHSENRDTSDFKFLFAHRYDQRQLVAFNIFTDYPAFISLVGFLPVVLGDLAPVQNLQEIVAVNIAPLHAVVPAVFPKINPVVLYNFPDERFDLSPVFTHKYRQC
jgi:hypothetical protein